jgi:hypothetical protein
MGDLSILYQFPYYLTSPALRRLDPTRINVQEFATALIADGEAHFECLPIHVVDKLSIELCGNHRPGEQVTADPAESLIP